VTGPELERALFHWPAVIAGLERGSWEHGFALSVLRNARNRAWRPTPRQAAVMRDILAALLRTDWRQGEVIEREAPAA
jgi:hypothetical protein